MGLTLLLFLAAVGPACLMYASTAMGMPMGQPHPAPMDCGDNQGSSDAACPHSNPVEVTKDSVRDDGPPLAVVAIADVSLPVFSGTSLGISRAEGYLSPPPSQLIPLRL